MDEVEFLFTDFRLDPDGPCLYRVDKTGKAAEKPVRLSDHAYVLLALLIERKGKVATWKDIFDRVWHVGSKDMDRSNIHVLVHELRKVLGEGCIETQTGYGYRLVIEVTEYQRPSLKQKDEPAITTLYGLSPERLQHMIKETVTGAGRLPTAEVDEFSNRLKVTQNAAIELLRIIGQANVLPERLPEKLVEVARQSASTASLGVCAPRLSIVVLPFANLSNNEEDQYLAEAITDDVTTDLSRIPEMLVISRTTASTYGHEPVNIRQIGQELNVCYVLEGSVRRAGRRVRVNIQLIDAERDVHIRAERFDHDTDDLFALQDQITNQIAVALNLGLVEVEAARPSDHPDALDYILRGRAAFYDSKGVTRERLAQAIGHFEKALSLAPASINTKAFLAVALAGRVLEQLSDAAAVDIDWAEQLIEQVQAVSPSHPIAHFAKAQLLRAQGKYEAAIPEYEIAIAADRNWVVAIANLGFCKFLAGRVEEAIPAQEQAIRLSPRDPRLPNWYWRIGMVHLLQSRVEDAIMWLKQARSINPHLPGPHAWLASAYALIGDQNRAGEGLAEARRLSGDQRYSSIARFRQRRLLGSEKTYELAEATFFAGLRKAGVPKED